MKKEIKQLIKKLAEETNLLDLMNSAILFSLDENDRGVITQALFARMFDCSRSKVKYRIDKLKDLGLVEIKKDRVYRNVIRPNSSAFDLVLQMIKEKYDEEELREKLKEGKKI